MFTALTMPGLLANVLLIIVTFVSVLLVAPPLPPPRPTAPYWVLPVTRLLTMRTLLTTLFDVGGSLGEFFSPTKIRIAGPTLLRNTLRAIRVSSIRQPVVAP